MDPLPRRPVPRVDRRQIVSIPVVSPELPRPMRMQPSRAHRDVSRPDLSAEETRVPCRFEIEAAARPERSYPASSPETAGEISATRAEDGARARAHDSFGKVG